MATKSLSRRFGIRHILKVATDLAINGEAMKSLYLTYKFNGKEKDDKFEIYKFSLFNREHEVKRSLNNGVLYLKGKFGCFKAEEVDKVILSAIQSHV